jgi:hypothetical protein
VLPALRAALANWAAAADYLEVAAGRASARVDAQLAEHYPAEHRRTIADLRVALATVADDVMAGRGGGTVIELDRRAPDRDPLEPRHNPFDEACRAHVAADPVDPAARCATCRA